MPVTVRLSARLASSTLVFLLPACTAASAPVRAASRPSAPARAGALSTAPGPATSDAFDDADENDPATLEPLIAKGARPALSKSTVGERECWQHVPLSGEARRDFASLVDHCGKPTGAFEYAKPATGKLSDVHDKGDTFIVFLRAGYCYRFFGVADSTIPNLDILIERNGALEAEDRTRGPVAVIDADRAWCMDSDAEYRFVVQISGVGQGRYVFGVWARPAT
jgi:hypothetical protein